MDEQVPVIKTKVLVPGKRRDLLRRARLVDFIHEHIDRKLILISAAAGYGKTSLLVDFAHDTELPVCWYTPDEWDRDPRVFLEYLVASISERFPRFGERTLAALRGGLRVEGVRSILGTLVNEIYEDIPDYFAVIIDDFHLISDAEEVSSLLGFLLRRLPENCRVILASRTTTLGLPIVELMAHQQLAGLGNEDLKFTAAEIQQLLKQNHNVDLPADQAERLAEYSEGWITAIVLTTYQLWKGLLQTMAQARGDDSRIFAYLAREVLEQQPEDVQDFLKGSSVLDRMNPQLCDELLNMDSSRDMLSLLEDKNLFISRLEGDGGHWYRYHPLFREFLVSKLREERDRYVSLHRKAGDLFDARKSWDEAIRHYLEAEAYVQAGQLVEKLAGWAFKSGRWSSLLSWTGSLEGNVSVSPWVFYWQSKVLTDSGRLDDAILTLEGAREGFAGTGERMGIVRALLQESSIHRLRGEYDQAIAKAEQVLSYAGGGEEKAAKALAHRTLGVCYGLQGQHDEGLAHLQEALESFELLGDEYNVANTLHDMGMIYLPVDDAKFLDYSRKALSYWHRLGTKGPLAMTLNNIGVAHYRRGRFDEALKTLRESLVASQAMGMLRPQAYAQASVGDVHRAKGDYGAAQQAYEEALVLAEQAGEAFLETYLLDALGNLERVLGEYDKAEELTGLAIEQGYEHGSDYEVGVSQISLGILYHVRGRDEEALKLLQQAVAKLQDTGVKQELAKAHFHLASVLFSRGEVSESVLNLEVALDVLSEAGFDPVLCDEGTGSRPLLEYVAGDSVLQGYRSLVQALLSRTEPARENFPVQVEAVPTTPLEFSALGRSKVLRDGEPVASRELRLRAREMLFLFLAHRAATKDQIVAALWPESPVAKAHSSFHFNLYQVRRLLGGSDAISYMGGTYRLESSRYTYDVDEFSRALAKAQKARGDQRAAYLREAISTYQGDYLEDVYSDWTAETRASLEREYFHALQELAAYYLQEGRYEEAAQFGRRLLDKDPLREDIHRLVILALAGAGDRAGAMSQYEKLRRILSEELGAGPSPDTITLLEGLMEEDS